LGAFLEIIEIFFKFEEYAFFASRKRRKCMGFLDKMMGKQEYPELDPSSPATARLEQFRGQLEELSEQTGKQPLEIVPGDERAFIFIGKPPEKFGVAWIEEGEINNLKTLVDQGKITAQQAQDLAGQLRKVYEANQQDERFTAALGDRNVVVTPSDEFRSKVRDVIKETVH